jgi:hypothetical protein
VTENTGLRMVVSCEIGVSQRGPEPRNLKAEDIVVIRCQAALNEDIEDLMRAVVISYMCRSVNLL